MTTAVASDKQKTLLIVKKWEALYDNAKYLGCEHRHKEKEYGLKWRQAYKVKLQDQFEYLTNKFGNPLDGE